MRTQLESVALRTQVLSSYRIITTTVLKGVSLPGIATINKQQLIKQGN